MEKEEEVSLQELLSGRRGELAYRMDALDFRLLEVQRGAAQNRRALRRLARQLGIRLSLPSRG